MTLVLIEGWDHLADGVQVNRKGWGSLSGSDIVAGRPLTSNSRAVLVHLNTSAPLRKMLPATFATLIVGFAYKPPSLERSINFFALETAALAPIAALRLNATWQIELLDSTGAAVATGATPLVPGDWHFIELKVAVGGNAELHLNGAAGEIAATAGTWGATDIGVVTFNATALTDSEIFDDVYALDSSGSAPTNDFLGDVAVETLYPAADGTYTDWTPDIGTDHFARANESQADGDASVVTDVTPGDKDSYQISPLGISTGTIYGAQLNLYARKNDSGLREIAPLIRQSGVDHAGDTVILGTSYRFHSWLLDDDPAGSDWTITTINADEYGIEMIA